MTEEKENHIRDYVRIVLKRKYTVVTFFIGTMVLVLLNTIPNLPVYTASTQLLIQKNNSGSLMGYGGYSGYDPNFYGTQYQIIRSVSVGKKVVKKLNLEQTYDSYFKDIKEPFSLVGSIRGWIGDFYYNSLSMIGVGQADIITVEDDQKADDRVAYSPDSISKLDSLAMSISGGVQVYPVQESNMVDVLFTSENPAFASKVVNTVAKAYIEELLDMKMASTEHTIKWMTEKSDIERRKLDDSEKRLQGYVRKNNIITIRNQVALDPENLSSLNQSLMAAETKKNELQIQYSNILGTSRKDLESVPVIARDNNIQNIKDSIRNTEKNILELSKKYGHKHPLMKNARADQASLKKKKQKEIDLLIRTIKNSFEIANINVNTLKKKLENAKNEMFTVNEKLVQYNILNREVESNRFIYDALMKKIKEQSVTDQVKIADVVILSKARTPMYPSNDRKARNIFLGIVVGLLGGIGLSLFVDYLDNTVKSPEDVEEKLKLPVYGTIPRLKGKDKDIEHIVLNEPLSSMAENYKAIRTSVLLSNAGKPPQNIMVSSMSQQEGKSSTSANLAVAIAKTDKRVLLVDADLRRPRVHKIFKMKNNAGLSTFLAGISTENLIQQGPVDNLKIMTSGPIPPNPSELLGSKKMDEFLKICDQKFDAVIIDTSPVLAVTDSLVIVRHMEAIVLVTNEGKTTYEDVSKGVKSIQDISKSPIGIVINKVNTKNSSYYYGNNYYYSSEDAEES